MAVGAFLSGLVLATANPVSIIFWLSLVGNHTAAEHTFTLTLAHCLFVVLGAATLFLVVVRGAARLHLNTHSSYILWPARAFGLIIMTYGLMMWTKINF